MSTPTTDEDQDDWETASDSLEDAIARSLADAMQTWETYHNPDEGEANGLEFPASYFLDRLQERGYDVTTRTASEAEETV